jgi:hypothetical protein
VAKQLNKAIVPRKGNVFIIIINKYIIGFYIDYTDKDKIYRGI